VIRGSWPGAIDEKMHMRRPHRMGRRVLQDSFSPDRDRRSGSDSWQGRMVAKEETAIGIGDEPRAGMTVHCVS